MKDVRLKEEDLHQYVKLDHFNAHQYIRDAKIGKILWCGPDSYLANQKAKELKQYF